MFLTSDFDLPATTISALYKSRWQIELFFKWIKQHLRIKTFDGTSQNAVKAQIWIAVSAYLLVAIIKKRLGLEMSLYTIQQILSVSIFEKAPLAKLFSQSNYSYSQPYGPNQLLIFDQRWDTTGRNPFVSVSTPSSIDESRNVFVERDAIYRVMDHAPDAEFRAMLGLSRFAGLRVPSEALSLEWRHVDWHRGTITVISPKTKRNPGGGSREVPLYDVLVRLLQDAFAQADEGAVYVISIYRSKAAGSDGFRGTNMGRPLRNTVYKAGLEPWPKP